jgi:hypothetical protein
METEFSPVGTRAPSGRQLETPCEAVLEAMIHLVEAIQTHYPHEAEALADGCNVWVLSGDKKSNHLFRLAMR